MKKKLLVLFLALVCLMSVLLIASCGGGNGGNGNGNEPGNGNIDDGRPSFTVTFDPAGGSFDGELTIEVKEGDKIPEPPKPVADGKIFSGWYAGKSKDSKWDFANDVVTSDVTLKAWYAGGVGCSHEVTIPLPEKSTPATCEKGGKEYVKCTKCGLTTFTNIPKLGHDLVTEVIEVTCATDGYTHVYCTREGCDEDRVHSTIPATGNHTWGDKFETLVSPTMYVGGKEARVCQVCGANMVFTIPSLAELDELLWDLDIGNYTYTGGEYVNASFVDIAKIAGISATSYYTVCLAKNAIDGSTNTFWCADTLADGAGFTGDTVDLTFAQSFDIGMVKIVAPHYSAWNLGEDCYVSYDLQAFIDGEWQTVGVLSDKNAVPAGISGAIIYEFEAPITTNALRLEVSHSTRNTPAMIYEIEVMAAVKETERVAMDLINSATINSSGKYNSWATGTETLMDGSHSTGWYTNRTGDIYATMTFPDDLFVTAVQFSVAPNTNKEYTIYYLDENDNWVAACKYKIQLSGGNVVLSGDSNSDGEPDGFLINADGSKRVIFTCDIARFTSGVKLTVDVPGPAWESYIYEFVPYTAVEQAVISSPETPDGVEKYTGCAHNSFKEIEKVTPTCSNAGYTIMECYGCGFKCKTDAVDSYGHLWGDYEILTAAEGSAAGTKHSVCQKPECDAERTTSYYNDFEDAKITTYKNNAPAAWAQTLDDGNYLGTYEWLIPKLQKYGWKASIMLSITFSDIYVDIWQEHFATGVLDLGSHSYTHGGYYSGQISENSLLSDVVNAHYWFMSKYAGQRILGFATPNGQTSTGTSEYVTGIMSSARNGGNSKYFYNIIDELRTNGYGQSAYVGSITVDEETGEVIFTQATNKEGAPTWVTTRRAWGNMNSYISKADQTEGPFIFTTADNTFAAQYKVVTQAPVIDEATGEQLVDENGNLVWETLKDPIYEETNGGYDVDQNGKYTFNEKGGTHALLKSPMGTYFYVERANANVNYVYDEATNRLADKGRTSGTYVFYETKNSNGVQTDAYFEWVEVGSYDYSNGTYVFRNDENGAYKLNHTALGSYEKGINEILSVGGMTVECLHEIGNGGTIWSTYASTNSKFQYLYQTGVWVCSYTELIQYMKEELSATLTTVSRTDNQIELILTDTLDDYMYNIALTIQVDIDDSWTEESLSATQDGKAIEFFVENGYAYVNAVPDQGAIVLSYNG